MAIPLAAIQLTGSEDYFREVLRPNFDAFFSHRSSFASAVNLATSLFHFHEWLYFDHQSPLEAHLGQTFPKKGAFWGAVLRTDKRFGYIRDVTNASKHVALSSASTGMSHMANTYIMDMGFGGSSYGRGRFGDSRQIMFADGGNLISFDACARALFHYWKTLLEAVTGRPQP